LIALIINTHHGFQQSGFR